MKILGDLLGYILFSLLDLTKSYGVAIVLFTLFVKLLVVPLDIKRQKSMAHMARLSKKQNELRNRYKNDRIKLNEEQIKLFEREGVAPSGGMLAMILPLFILMGVYSTVINPLTSMFRFPGDTVKAAIELVKNDEEIDKISNSAYNEIEVIKANEKKPEAFEMFSQEQKDILCKYRDAFNFLGMDVFKAPKQEGFESMLWTIPFLSFITSAASAFIMNKMQKKTQPQTMSGCVNIMPYIVPVLTTWFAYTAPIALGIYWIISNLFSTIQFFIFNKVYSPEIITAREESARIALRVQQEG